jgi:hypothetical protein
VVALFPVVVWAQERQPELPLDEIVRRFAAKEDDYARAHGQYQYELSIKVQELGEAGGVSGDFEQLATVSRDPRGRRTLQLLGNPRTDLLHFPLTRVELDDLHFIPLFVLASEDVPFYEISYLTRERLDEVETYLFRLEPNRPARRGEHLFDGLVWVDTEKLDIVRLHGRTLPVEETGALKGYFRRVEVYREPVDEFLFPTYVRAEDVYPVHPAGTPLRVRLVVRFSKHKRLEQPEPAEGTSASSQTSSSGVESSGTR